MQPDVRETSAASDAVPGVENPGKARRKHIRAGRIARNHLSSASAAALRATTPTSRLAQAGTLVPIEMLPLGLRDLPTASAGQQEEHDCPRGGLVLIFANGGHGERLRSLLRVLVKSKSDISGKQIVGREAGCRRRQLLRRFAVEFISLTSHLMCPRRLSFLYVHTPLRYFFAPRLAQVCRDRPFGALELACGGWCRSVASVTPAISTRADSGHVEA